MLDFASDGVGGEREVVALRLPAPETYYFARGCCGKDSSELMLHLVHVWLFETKQHFVIVHVCLNVSYSEMFRWKVSFGP